ncbi:MAG TPA: glycosyltransferase [Rubrivivax sp.]|nr:glycosyltransferase [Rubrivivax sp.]HPO18521.1 glycosyltransferase [Rubrivivax sp.]
MTTMRLVLFGDGESPHLLKWARALAGRVELWAASSRGFPAAFDALLPPERLLALHTTPKAAGGNAALLRQLPRLARWLRQVQPDWIHAHYLTSHGTLAWAATSLLGAPGRLVGSAWGSDVLVTPQHSVLQRWLLARVLRACALCTADSKHMAARMRDYGAAEPMCFPFGLEALPPLPAHGGGKDDKLFFANRALEPIYAPDRVIGCFAAIAAHWSDARLVLANDGSLRDALQLQVRNLGLQDQVRFVGRLGADAQAEHYRRARWYLSLPRSDSVSVSVLEAMAHGCVPLLSDLPANHELVASGGNGLILPLGALPTVAALQPLLGRGEAIAQANRGWVREHAMFAPWVERFVARLRELHAAQRP